MKRLIALVLAAAVVLCNACGGGGFATSLRLALAAGAPVLDVLQQQGKISPELRAGLITDLSNEALAVGDLSTCFKSIPSGDPQSKLKHLRCVQALDQSAATNKLVTDFGKSKVVANIADDVSAILEAAIIFYGGTTSAQARVTVQSTRPITEAEINARIKRLKADLGQ